jgi:hypothetical protein
MLLITTEELVVMHCHCYAIIVIKISSENWVVRLGQCMASQWLDQSLTLGSSVGPPGNVHDWGDLIGSVRVLEPTSTA